MIEMQSQLCPPILFIGLFFSPMPVLIGNGGIYRKTFPPSGRGIILVFEPQCCYKIPREPLQRER